MILQLCCFCLLFWFLGYFCKSTCLNCDVQNQCFSSPPNPFAFSSHPVVSWLHVDYRIDLPKEDEYTYWHHSCGSPALCWFTTNCSPRHQCTSGNAKPYQVDTQVYWYQYSPTLRIRLHTTCMRYQALATNQLGFLHHNIEPMFKIRELVSCQGFLQPKAISQVPISLVFRDWCHMSHATALDLSACMLKHVPSYIVVAYSMHTSHLCCFLVAVQNLTGSGSGLCLCLSLWCCFCLWHNTGFSNLLAGSAVCLIGCI